MAAYRMEKLLSPWKVGLTNNTTMKLSVQEQRLSKLIAKLKQPPNKSFDYARPQALPPKKRYSNAPQYQGHYKVSPASRDALLSNTRAAQPSDRTSLVTPGLEWAGHPHATGGPYPAPHVHTSLPPLAIL
jgi:hypothetical protein